MAIFTKDGKMYVVEGPNPLANKQVSWDRSKLVFHNFAWDEIRNGSGDTRETPEETCSASKPYELGTKEPPEFVDTGRESEILHHPSARQEEAESTEESREFDLPYIKYKVLCHCLPAKVEQRADSFYGESWSRIKYGKKFVFPCVVISSTDLSFEFWTSDPRGQVVEKSVIYPFSYEVHNKATNSYDKVPYDDYRWWRVETKEAKEGGWLFHANPSDVQPDFSD